MPYTPPGTDPTGNPHPPPPPAEPAVKKPVPAPPEPPPAGQKALKSSRNQKKWLTQRINWRTLKAMNAAWQHISANWKTSLSGILTATIALGTYFSAVPSNIIPQHYAVIITVAVGAAKVLLGLIQSDAKPSVTSSVTIETTTPKEKQNAG